MDEERHEMELVEEHPNGSEEWHCPTCDRRFIMQWPPNYKRVILVDGDEEVIHSGGKMGVIMETDRLGVSSAPPQEEKEVHLSDELIEGLNNLDWGDWEDE